MRFASCFALAFILSLSFSTRVLAGDLPGHWKWQITPQGGDPIDMSADLKVDGAKITGVFLDGFDGQKFDIKDGKLDGDKVSFTVVRPFNDQTITVNYAGTLDADTIKGTVEVKFADQDPTKSDWKAERTKEAATQPATQP